MNEQSGRGKSIRLEGVSASYGTHAVVDRLSLTVGAGEFFTLLGPSGCGKTTTLRLVAGLIRPSAGKIALGDRDVTQTPVHKRAVAMVFQNYALMPHLSVLDNVAYGLASAGVGRRERRAQAQHALKKVGLDGFDERYPAQLSGGQQQRVGLARAVAVGSGVMLLDEPLSNLDTSLRQQMCLELRDLQRDLGVTILYVTHDRSEALSMSDRIAVMSEGHVIGLGTPSDLYDAPADAATARMLGDVNEVRGTAKGGALRVGPATLPVDVADGPILLGVRPERVTIARSGGTPGAGLVALSGTVRWTEYGGSHRDVAVDVPGVERPIVARIAAEESAPHPAGTQVNVVWRTQDTLLLREAP